MMKKKFHSRSGFTLVELLVVIAIIGILVGLLFPAIQQVRESARRINCLNNQRQIGLALNNYHAARDEFPIGCVEWRGFGQPEHRQLAWSAFLLPYLEQQNVFEMLSFDEPFDAATNEAAAATVIKTYQCPSTLRNEELSDGRGPIDYGGIYGERITSPNNPPKGVMLIDQSVSIRDVRDGSSNTLIVGEDAGWSDGQWINGRNIFDQAFEINKAPAFENDLRSDHPGGVVVCYCDGHVRFLAEQTELDVLAAICTRAGGEINVDVE